MEENRNEIKNPWCTYGWFLGPWGVGKVEVEDADIVYIRYSENQMYPVECWDSKWVKRFHNLWDAIEEYYPHSELSKKELFRITRQSFPSEFKKFLPVPISNPH